MHAKEMHIVWCMLRRCRICIFRSSYAMLFWLGQSKLRHTQKVVIQRFTAPSCWRSASLIFSLTEHILHGILLIFMSVETQFSFDGDEFCAIYRRQFQPRIHLFNIRNWQRISPRARKIFSMLLLQNPRDILRTLQLIDRSIDNALSKLKLHPVSPVDKSS